MNALPISRRQFLGGATAWLGTTALGFGEDLTDTKTISIFHTTDLHGHIVPTSNYAGISDLGGLARCVTCIRDWKKQNPDSLIVDIGDVYQGTAESLINGGNMMIGLFNRIGYNAWTLGNHDFDWGRESLETNLRLSKSPVLTGNIGMGGKIAGDFEGNWKSVVPWTIKEIGGFQIALVGLTTPGLPYWLSPATMDGVSVEDPAISLEKSVNEAKAAGANAIILMGHMGYRAKDDFANPLRDLFSRIKGVDVLLAGHTHQNQPSWNTGGVLCSQASYYGIHCGKLDLSFDRNSKKLIRCSAATELMDNRFALDPAVMEAAGPELKKAEEQLARKVCTVTATIPGKRRGNRLAALFCETFFEALQRNQTPVDGIFHGTFGTGDLQPGEITVADCWRLLPYENLLTIIEVSPQELIEIVKEDGAEKDSDRMLWPFDLTLDPQGRPERFLFKGEAVAPGRRFRIGLNSYDAQSGGQRLMKLRAIAAQPEAGRITTGIDTRSALIDGLLNRKTLF